MVDFNSLSDHAQFYILSAIDELISYNMVNSADTGLQVGQLWLTPETCYWLYKFLSQESDVFIVQPVVLEALKNGCNHPELV